MKVRLVSEFGGGCWRVPEAVWEKALSVAEEYGWEPAGTDPPYGRWGDYGYLIRRGQVVHADDAEALADALEEALDDNGVRVGNIEQTRRLVDFCREGPFSIM